MNKFPAPIAKFKLNSIAYCAIFVGLLMSVFAINSCVSDDDVNPQPGGLGSGYIYQYPVPHQTGVPVLSGNLDTANTVMKSILVIDLNRNVARLPLFKGTFNGNRVWFIRTDVSDARLALSLGLNFAPRLKSAGSGCVTCIQNVISEDTIPGKSEVQFAGMVDFSPVRNIIPGATGFPPLSVTPGGVGSEFYSDLIRVRGSSTVYNAPIIATGTGPFDVSQSHSNTHDRVIEIDTVNLTVDLKFVRAFAFGKDIFYLTIGATSQETATVERATYVLAMAGIPAPGINDISATACADMYSFTNGKLGLNDANSQGLNHLLLDNAPGELSNSNPGLFNTLRNFGDARNVLGKFTTLNDDEKFLYSPLWDVYYCTWTDSVVTAGVNYAQNDANTIGQLANRGYITNQDGSPLSSSGLILNCSIIGFALSPPLYDQAPEPQ